MTPFLAGSTPPTVNPALVWPFAHNWRIPASERLEWKTSVHESQASVETRRAWRREPRLYMGYESLAAGSEVALLQALLRSWHGREWAVPAWWGAAHLTLSADVTLTLDRSTSTLWPASGWGLLWRSAEDTELIRVDSVLPTGLTLTAPPLGVWGPGSLVVPLHFATLDDTQSWSAVTGEVVQAATQWSVLPGTGTVLVEEAPDWPHTFPTSGSVPTVRDQIVFGMHNWQQPVSLSAGSLTDVFDPGIGLLKRRLARTEPRLTWQSRELLGTAEDTAAFRRLLALRRGQAVSMFAANPAIDLGIAGIAGPEVTLGAPVLVRGVLTEVFAGLLLCDDAGTRSYALASATGLTLTLTETPTITGVVRWARLISRARLAADAVEISHHSLGVAEVSYSVRTVGSVATDPVEGGFFTLTAGAYSSANDAGFGGNITPFYLSWPTPPAGATGVSITITSGNTGSLYQLGGSWFGVSSPVLLTFGTANVTTTSGQLGLGIPDHSALHGTLRFADSYGPFGPVYTTGT